MTRQLTITTALLAFLSFSGQWHDSAAAFSPAWAPSNGTDNGGRTPACVIRNGSGQEAGAIPACATSGQRSVQLLTEWEFRRDHDMQAADGWEKVAAAVASTWKGCIVSPYLMVQCSDSRHYGRISDKVYRFSAMDLTAEERATIHGNDEHIRIETAKKAAEFYIRLMRMC